MVDDRSLHPALAYALALDDAVGRGEVNRPTLLIGKRFQLRAEQRHHVVARRNDIRFRSGLSYIPFAGAKVEIVFEFSK